LAPKTCQKLNDTLYTSLVMHPDKFSALAMLPCADGKEAAAELQRCVMKYRFVGGVLGFRRSGIGGEGSWRAWEGREWEELWRVAERLGVPLALRPLWVTMEEVRVLTVGSRTYSGLGR
jgi:predicted TIM-barrel fold metal-dependent hydrolase